MAVASYPMMLFSGFGNTTALVAVDVRYCWRALRGSTRMLRGLLGVAGERLGLLGGVRRVAS